ncbi:MAG: class I SAM-dependent methyltransferase [Mucilaginibacter sp.]
MQQTEAINLLKSGILTKEIQRWADLGCGSGTFTIALAELLAPGGEIYAVDVKRQTLPHAHNNVAIHFEQLDFEREQLPYPELDGVLMANSLHYIKDKSRLIQRLAAPSFIVVEYEHRKANPWVPYPINSTELTGIFAQLGYQAQPLANTPSRFGGSLYSMLAFK